jgi:hypothetical protein
MDGSREDRMREHTESSEGVSKPTSPCILILHADSRQLSAEHQNRSSDSAAATLEVIRSRRVWENSLRRLDQYTNEYYLGDNARARDEDAHSDVEYDCPAWLEYVEKNPDFKVHRQEYAEAMKKASSSGVRHAGWPDTLEGVHVGHVIDFPIAEDVQDPHLLADKDLSWAPAPGCSRIRVNYRHAIVIRENHELVIARILYTFEDIPDSPERGQEVIDDMSGETRYVLDEYLHVVAIDSEGPVRTEPQCFGGGIQCSWRTTDCVSPPSSKNWFMDTGEPHCVMSGTPLRVVGGVSPADYATLHLVSEAHCIRLIKRVGKQTLLAEQAEHAKEMKWRETVLAGVAKNGDVIDPEVVDQVLSKGYREFCKEHPWY